MDEVQVIELRKDTHVQQMSTLGDNRAGVESPLQQKAWKIDHYPELKDKTLTLDKSWLRKISCTLF